MPKQLQTALEARRWMVANPKHTVTDKYGKLHYWWDDSECKFFSEAEVVIISDIFAPFTIIDEPTVRESRTTQTDPQTGELYSADWVRVQVSAAAYGMTQTPTHRWAVTPSEALQHICQQAKQVRITWPEWSSTSTSEHKIYRHFANEVAMEIFFALQIGAVVEYLPKEGK